MRVALLIIGAVLISRYYKNHSTQVPPSANNTGKPVWNAALLPSDVPVTNNTPITEAAYYQQPMDYTPAFGSEIELNGQEYVL